MVVSEPIHSVGIASEAEVQGEQDSWKMGVIRRQLLSGLGDNM